MRLSTALIFILLIYLSPMFAQDLTLEPYFFVSKANDSVQAELGTFYVLEDRSNGKGDSIPLSFLRFKSTHPNPGSPIGYLSGGPGGSGTGTAQGSRFELFMKLREVADVIAFDQRGTGLSHNLPNCPCRADFALEKAIERGEYIEKTTKNIAKYLEFWEEKNVNLGAYNTTESAKDLDRLRSAVATFYLKNPEDSRKLPKAYLQM